LLSILPCVLLFVLRQGGRLPTFLQLRQQGEDLQDGNRKKRQCWGSLTNSGHHLASNSLGQQQDGMATNEKKQGTIGGLQHHHLIPSSYYCVAQQQISIDTPGYSTEQQDTAEACLPPCWSLDCVDCLPTYGRWLAVASINT
jgi:hypothetical protein